MFTAEQRDRARAWVIALAQADSRVIAGALTGSTAFGAGDAWSDIDVAFGIVQGSALEDVLQDWMQALDREFGVLSHFDLRAGSWIYRAYLLHDGLEIDVGLAPEKDFGARGPNFHPLFGPTRQLEAAPPPNTAHMIGLSWHHVLHARSCIERHKLWQAEYWISEIRNHVIALTCLRLGQDASHGRGVDRLPSAVTAPFTETLVRSLDPPELRRALAAATGCLLEEIARRDEALCARLTPILREFGGHGQR